MKAQLKTSVALYDQSSRKVLQYSMLGLIVDHHAIWNPRLCSIICSMSACDHCAMVAGSSLASDDGSARARRHVTSHEKRMVGQHRFLANSIWRVEAVVNWLTSEYSNTLGSAFVSSCAKSSVQAAIGGQIYRGELGRKVSREKR